MTLQLLRYKTYVDSIYVEGVGGVKTNSPSPRSTFTRRTLEVLRFISFMGTFGATARLRTISKE